MINQASLGYITGIPQYFCLFLKRFRHTIILKTGSWSKGFLCLYTAMKHPHLWKYFYSDLVKDFAGLPGWHSLMEEAYSFSEWYHTTPRSDRAYLSCIPQEQDVKLLSTEVTHLKGTLLKPYTTGLYDNQEKLEAEAIQRYVQEFVHDITEKVGSLDKRFASTPILSGSVAEGAKIGLPDEYDFILHLHELQEEFDRCELEIDVAAVTQFRVNMDIPQLFEDYFSTFDEQLQKYEFTNGFSLDRLPKENEDSKPFTVTLLWRGRFFKDLQVNIDLVPAFKISYPKVQARLFGLNQDIIKSQLFAIMKSSGYKFESLRLSFSIHERDLLQGLPMYVKNGYRLAKAVRHTEVCPKVKASEMAFASVDEYLTTYMLKTCLLHSLKEFDWPILDENDWLNPLSIDCAITIYEQIKYFWEIFEGKIPNYFQTTSDICSGYQVANQRGEQEEKHDRKKQKVTLTFINYILQLLHELLHQCSRVLCYDRCHSVH